MTLFVQYIVILAGKPGKLNLQKVSFFVSFIMFTRLGLTEPGNNKEAPAGQRDCPRNTQNTRNARNLRCFATLQTFPCPSGCSVGNISSLWTRSVGDNSERAIRDRHCCRPQPVKRPDYLVAKEPALLSGQPLEARQIKMTIKRKYLRDMPGCHKRKGDAVCEGHALIRKFCEQLQSTQLILSVGPPYLESM